MTLPRRRSTVICKIALLILGLRLLFRPELPSRGGAAYHKGLVSGKAFGGLLLVIAAIPFGAPPRSAGDDPEEL